MTDDNTAIRQQRAERRAKAAARLARILVLEYANEATAHDPLVHVDVAPQLDLTKRSIRNSSALAATDSDFTEVDAGGEGVASGLLLRVAPPEAGHRWIDKKDPIEVWRSLNAAVQLVTGVDGKFASVIVHGESIQLQEWMFEAVALGPGEEPDFHRDMTEPQPLGAVVELETSPHFCLNQPLRIALYVSDGLSVLGCLVFAMDGS